MTVNEFSKLCKSTLRVMSAYNGKILCYNYTTNSEKHAEIGKREVLDIWSDIIVTDSGFGHYATPILCAYVDGKPEYNKEHNINV